MAFHDDKCQILRMVKAISTGAFRSRTTAGRAVACCAAECLRAPCNRGLRPHVPPNRVSPPAVSGGMWKTWFGLKKSLDRLVGRAYMFVPPRRSFAVLPNRSDVGSRSGGCIGCSFDKLVDVKRGCAGGVRAGCASSEERGWVRRLLVRGESFGLVDGWICLRPV